ncbi:hypothetical protein FRC03_008350 [Tulasnella sp. 419]|nr:hypothetical protein FRC02_009014 [Tulasnella sp. 418]KAG8968215.1 hypothetical protein FRC03_008350 [Tulasnella sp. 419]
MPSTYYDVICVPEQAVDSLEIKAIHEYDRSRHFAHKGSDIRKKFNGTGNRTTKTLQHRSVPSRREAFGPTGVLKEKEKLALGDASRRKRETVVKLPKLKWDDDGDYLEDTDSDRDADKDEKYYVGKENISSPISVGLADLVRPVKTRKETRRSQPIRERSVEVETVSFMVETLDIQEELMSPLFSDGEDYDSDDDGIEEYEFMLPGEDGCWMAVESDASVVVLRGW